MIELEIEKLLDYALREGLIEQSDRIQMRNLLLDLLGRIKPYEGELPKSPEPGTDVIRNICKHAVENGLADDEERFAARLMGMLTPRQSQVSSAFSAKYAVNPKAATDWFYKFSKAADYIRTAEIARNLYWRVITSYGEVEITINLSKPEKDPKQIALAKKQPQTGYPKCLLCMENVGFSGNANHPARQNHRVIPLTLQGADWYLQYSPYVYYNEHCIVLNGKHTPMRLSENTFTALFEFVEKFPHYFIGSNADLPIVGGSILSHDHFQGGRHIFPMELAETERRFTHAGFPGLSVGVLKWPMSVIRISGRDSNEAAGLAARLYSLWKDYSDEQADILAFTGEPHNTVTPIARKRGGLFEMDIVLRNNRTSEKYPLGIFHPHEDVWHIKKENIGLIEVMGLAVLPGRLKNELDLVAKILCGESVSDPALDKHAAWIQEMTETNKRRMNLKEADKLLRHEVGQRFARVLADAGVFKRDDDGAKAFDRFLEACGLERSPMRGY